MGFLDDLKNRQSEPRADAGTASAGAQFAATIQPTLKGLYDYLKKLATHLNEREPDQGIAYEIEGYGTLGALRQRNFKASVDDPDLIQTCSLRYACLRPLGVEFYQPNKEAGERQQQYLWKHKLRFSSRKMPDERWLFELESYVPISFEFIINPSRQTIQLKVTNQETLGTVGYSYHPEDINPLFLDELAKYVMRRPSRFHELSGDVVPDDTLAKLRQQVAERKAEREKELGTRDKKPPSKGLFKGLFKK